MQIFLVVVVVAADRVGMPATTSDPPSTDDCHLNDDRSGQCVCAVARVYVETVCC